MGEKKIKGRKRHLCTDTLGLLIKVWVTPADASDGEVGAELLVCVKEEEPTVCKAFVDRASRGLMEDVGREIGVEVEVVCRPPGQKGFQPLPKRWVIERSFGWLNRYRRLSKDFEYWDDHSAAMVKIAFIQLMLKRWQLSAN